jgi:hypothetical protein
MTDWPRSGTISIPDAAAFLVPIGSLIGQTSFDDQIGLQALSFFAATALGWVRWPPGKTIWARKHEFTPGPSPRAEYNSWE